MRHFRYFLFFVPMTFFFASCNQKATIEGSVDYIGSSHIVIEEPPVHYKYAPVKKDTLIISEEGYFKTTLEPGNQELVYLKIGDDQYPLLISPGKQLHVDISRSEFPYNVEINGYSQKWYQNYDAYLKEVRNLDSRISSEIEKLKVGADNDVQSLSLSKIQLAQKHLKDTPFRDYYLRAVGEYLEYKIRSVEYNARNFENFDSASARNEVFSEAANYDFFSLESLKAQRAGIRDFTHYFSRTFGIYDSVNKAYGKQLAEYDIKNVAYNELNEKRNRVLQHIENRDALAHAEMHLVAERIGEQPLEVATPSYEQFLEEYQDYPEYTNFLKNFYNEIKSVSPGEPAISFSIPDSSGNIHRLEDYRGKFILLDFWAGWCTPCLDEFPYMKDIYKKYSRDDLDILAISTETDSLLWIQDIRHFSNPWLQLYGGKGFEQETFKAYKGGGIPFYILVDPDGNISRYNDIRPSFNFSAVLDSLISTRNALEPL